MKPLPLERLFGRDYLRFWRPRADSARADAEAAFLAKTLGVEPPARILDLGCGYGRHAVRLATMGFRVTGVDGSTTMLAEARKSRTPVEWVHGDMRRLRWTRRFDAAYCWFTTFGYFDDAGNERVLRGVARALAPGGRFVMDTRNRDRVATDPGSWWGEEGPAGFLLSNWEFDPLGGFSRSRFILVDRRGRRREYVGNIRFYTLTEYVALARKVGLEFVQAWGGVDEPFGARAGRMIAAVRRP